MELNLAWVVVSALNVLIFIAVILGSIWAVRRLRAVNGLERRVAALEERLREPDR